MKILTDYVYMLHAIREIAYFIHWAKKLLNACNGQLYCPLHAMDISSLIS